MCLSSLFCNDTSLVTYSEPAAARNGVRAGGALVWKAPGACDEEHWEDKMANAAAWIVSQLAGREGDVCPTPGAIWCGCQHRRADGVSSGVSHLVCHVNLKWQHPHLVSSALPGGLDSPGTEGVFSCMAAWKAVVQIRQGSLLWPCSSLGSGDVLPSRDGGFQKSERHLCPWHRNCQAGAMC